jgi:hypothetical protein
MLETSTVAHCSDPQLTSRRRSSSAPIGAMDKMRYGLSPLLWKRNKLAFVPLLISRSMNELRDVGMSFTKSTGAGHLCNWNSSVPV